MKNVVYFLFVSLFALSLSSCKKDEGKLPDISFKTGGNYVSSSTTVAAGSTVTIGIHAAKTEEEDVLKTFTVSLSLNGGATTTEYTTNLTSAEEDQFDFDFTPTLGLGVGDTYKFTFTVTNRDGLTNQVSLTLTTN